MKKLITATLLTLILLTSTTQAADEGIKVHGHWTFEIYNPDGSFDRKVEFENALAISGVTALLRIMEKKAIDYWFIRIDAGGLSMAGQHPCNDNSTPIPCSIGELGGPTNNGPSEFLNLTYQVANSKFILNGSFTTASGLVSPEIGKVETFINTCDVNSAGGDGQSGGLLCNVLNGTTFTEKTLASPISLSSGQIVQVTVEISFS